MSECNYTEPGADENRRQRIRSGYLTGDYRVFCLRTPIDRELTFHYHDFDKIIFFLKGDVRYMIEGRVYQLEPYDILLVRRGELHRPDASPACPYERIVLYVSADYLKQASGDKDDLYACFLQAQYRRTSVLRLQTSACRELFQLAQRLVSAQEDCGYANELYCRTLYLQLMILLNRAVREGQSGYLGTGSVNYQVSCVLSYINNNLSGDLGIERIARACYLSPYHMMRLFRQAMGCTIGGYIAEKRLAVARLLLESGDMSVTQACYQSGFKNYSTFSRAYKKRFGEPPGFCRKSAAASGGGSASRRSMGPRPAKPGDGI